MYEATYLASPLELSFADIGVHVVEDPSDIWPVKVQFANEITLQGTHHLSMCAPNPCASGVYSFNLIELNDPIVSESCSIRAAA